MAAPDDVAEPANDETAALRIDRETLEGARIRLRFDWRTFVYFVLAILGALALIAVFRGTTTMLTRIALGIVIALALDPLTRSLQHRFDMRRGVAVGVVALGVGTIAALLIGVLGPKAVAEARKFSEELPETLDQLESVPLVGGFLRDNQVADKVQEWLRRLPEQITDDRVAELASRLISGVASVAIIVVVVVAVLIDGENLLDRFRRLLRPSHRDRADAVGRVMYRTLGRYFGGSVTVAVLMGLYVLALGLALGIPLIPVAAIWAAITDLIPQVGGFLGGSFLVLLATTQSVTTGLITAAAFIIYMNFENHIIQPAIVGRSVDLTAPTTMVAAFVGGAVMGVPGALVATPIVGAVKAIYLEARGMAKPTEDIGARERLRQAFQRKKR